MKSLLRSLSRCRCFGSGTPLATALPLLATWTAGADISYTSTGWVMSVQDVPNSEGLSDLQLPAINAAGFFRLARP